MRDIAPTRVRIDLTPPQAVTQTSGLLYEPARRCSGAVVALAPGAGSDLMHPVLLAVAKGLAEAGHPTLLFNFPFTEAGRKRPDPPGRLELAYRDIIAWLQERYGTGRPLVIGGRSLGGRIASHVAADGVDCDGLILLGYPLHPRTRIGVGEQTRLRTGHWPELTTRTLFVQGDRDGLCDLVALQGERDRLLEHAESSVHIVRGADHAFGVRAGDDVSPADVLQEVRDVVVAWMEAGRPAAVRV